MPNSSNSSAKLSLRLESNPKVAPVAFSVSSVSMAPGVSADRGWKESRTCWPKDSASCSAGGCPTCSISRKMNRVQMPSDPEVFTSSCNSGLCAQYSCTQRSVNRHWKESISISRSSRHCWRASMKWGSDSRRVPSRSKMMASYIESVSWDVFGSEKRLDG